MQRIHTIKDPKFVLTMVSYDTSKYYNTKVLQFFPYYKTRYRDPRYDKDVLGQNE